MNMVIFIAGLLALFVVVGHFFFGIKWYLIPMLHSDTEAIPKATLQSVFHYISVFLVLSAIVLISMGIKKLSLEGNTLLIKFIGCNFLLFAFVQIIYSIKNRIEKPLITMFQWILFVPIGILCLL